MLAVPSMCVKGRHSLVGVSERPCFSAYLSILQREGASFSQRGLPASRLEQVPGRCPDAEGAFSVCGVRPEWLRAPPGRKTYSDVALEFLLK